MPSIAFSLTDADIKLVREASKARNGNMSAALKDLLQLASIFDSDTVAQIKDFSNSCKVKGIPMDVKSIINEGVKKEITKQSFALTINHIIV